MNSKVALNGKSAYLYNRNIKYIEKRSSVRFSGYQPENSELKPNADFRGRDLTGANLINKVIDSAQFQSSTLTDAQLQGSSLAEAQFQLATLKDTKLYNIKAPQADFSWANFEGVKPTDFENADLEGARFFNSKMNEINLFNATLHNAVFNTQNLLKANLRRIKANNVTFNNSNLSGAFLTNMEGENAKFQNSTLVGTLLGHATLNQGKFQFANLTDAELQGASLAEAQFHAATLKNAKLYNIKAPHADFSWADFEGEKPTSLESAELEGARFFNSKMNGSNLFNATLHDAIFNTQNLQKANLQRVKANNAIFNNSNLSGAFLTDMEGKNAKFQNATLTGAKLENATLNHGKFQQADLTDTELQGASLAKAKFHYAKLKNAKLYNIKAPQADFSWANFEGDKTTFMNGSELQGACFYGSKMNGVDLSDATLHDAAFYTPNLLKAKLERVKANNAIFNNSNLSGAFLTDMEGEGVKFQNAILVDAHLDHATLNQGKFQFANLTDARLYGASLAGAKFQSAILKNAKLSATNLANSDLMYANLTSANMTGAILDEANIAYAKFINTDLTDTDFTKVKNLKLATFENCFYNDGFKPKLPPGVSTEQLGIRKHKDTSKSGSTGKSEFMSFYSPAQFKKLTNQVSNNSQAKAEYRFFKYLAQGKESQDEMAEFINAGSHIDDTIEQLRGTFKGQEVSDSYIPLVRNGRNAEDEETSLELESFRLNECPDLHNLKDTCLAQQLYSAFIRHNDKTPKTLFSHPNRHERAAQQSLSPNEQKSAQFWLDRLKNAFEEDFESECSVSADDSTKSFLDWLKAKYHLYDSPQFEFERTLDAINNNDDDEKNGLSKVYGYSELKKKLTEQIIAPLTFPMISQTGAAKPEKGWIFYGEPGTGKSHLASAVSNQLGLRPVEVSLSSIGSSYENQTVRNLTTQFEKAKRLAQRHGASVILLDEMNQVGDARNSGNGSKSDLTNALLSMITKYIEQSKDNIICIGTTNDIKSVDPALKRAGRLGSHEEIDVPDLESRKAYLKERLPQGEYFLKPLDIYEGGSNEMIDYIARKTEGKSTATLKLLVERLTGGYRDKVTKMGVDSALAEIESELKRQI